LKGFINKLSNSISISRVPAAAACPFIWLLVNPPKLIPFPLKTMRCAALNVLRFVALKFIWKRFFFQATYTKPKQHTDTEWSEVNLLDVLYALNGRRTSSSLDRIGVGASRHRSLLNSCSALLSGSSARVPAHLLLLGLIFVCLLSLWVTPTSNQDQDSRRIKRDSHWKKSIRYSSKYNIFL